MPEYKEKRPSVLPAPRGGKNDRDRPYNRSRQNDYNTCPSGFATIFERTGVFIMARPKKPRYEFVPSLKLYRKRIKDADGKYVPIYGKTPEELTSKITEAADLIEQAKFRRENPTVKEYAEKWLTMHAPHINHNTLVDYTSVTENYIIDTLGDKFIADVTPDDLKLAMLKASCKSESIYSRTHMLMRMIFGSAYDNGLIGRDPTTRLSSKGGTPAKEKVPLTSEQSEILLDAVRGLPPYPFIMIGLYAGMRREEILGLMWKNVHLDKTPYIAVRTAWRTEHNRPVVTEILKTESSRRDIPIPPQLVECLKEHKKASRSAYVISNSECRPLSETQWQRVWKYVTTRSTMERTYKRYVNGVTITKTIKPELGEVCKHNPNVKYTIDFKVTPHLLRHTYITNLLQAGVDVKTVQYLAGHKKSKITLDIYAHLTYNKPEDLASKIATAF